MSFDLSVVIAVNNEEKNIAVLYARLKKVLGSLGQSCEIIFVEDVSSDHSYAELCRIYREDSAVNVIRLNRHCGQTIGLLVGMSLARSSVIITMDGDLQHDPDDIPRLLEKIGLGYDLVNGRKIERPDSLLKRTLPSLIVKKLVCWSFGSEYLDINSTFRAYRRKIVDDFKSKGEAFRFLPLVAKDRGIKFCEVAISCKKRTFGRTHYHLAGRLKRLIKDFVLLWSIKDEGAGSNIRPDHLISELRFHEEIRDPVLI